MKTPIVILNISENMFESLIKDFTSFVCVAGLIELSKGSVIWTVMMAGIFVLLIVAKISYLLGKQYRFSSKSDLIAWANTLED